MRGLDARVQLALARIMQLTDARTAFRMMDEVERMAEQTGIDDAAQGIGTMPVMFDDELLLAGLWRAGQKRYARGLDKTSWRTMCERMASDASIGCGLSYDYFVERLSSAVDCALGNLFNHERAEALAIAIELGYEPPERRDWTADHNETNGCCTHGIAMGYCPAGCDFPDDDFDPPTHGYEIE